MNQIDWSSLGIVLASLWASYTEFRLRQTQSKLRIIKNEKEDIIARETVHNLSDSDLNDFLSKYLKGSDQTKPNT